MFGSGAEHFELGFKILLALSAAEIAGTGILEWTRGMDTQQFPL